MEDGDHPTKNVLESCSAADLNSQVNTAHNSKQALIKARVQHYHRMLTQGCGNKGCTNKYCASSPMFTEGHLNPNQAAALALQLLQKNIIIGCAPVQTLSGSSHPGAHSAGPSSALCVSSPSGLHDITPPLSEALVLDTIAACKRQKKWTSLVKLLGSSYSQHEVLMNSFQLIQPDAFGFTVDIEAVQRTYSALFNLPEDVFQSALINALVHLSSNLCIELQYRGAYDRLPYLLDVFIIVLEIPALHSPEYLDKAYPEFLRAIINLPFQGHVQLVRYWSRRGKQHLHTTLISLHQLITIHVVSQSDAWDNLNIINNNEHICNAAKVMKLVYYASLLGGRLDPPETLRIENIYNTQLKQSIEDFIHSASGRSPVKDRVEVREDPLAKALNIKPIDCRQPVLMDSEFVNDAVNEVLEMDQDFTIYKSQSDKLSFIRHPFLLSTTTKSLAMYYDNRIRMISERRSAIFNSILHGAPSMPYLRLRVRRDHIIDDALVGLEMVFMDNPNDLKKQLYVEFDGEQGIDEGGVSKEFFQLIVEELFNADFGMFFYDEHIRQFWFNTDSYENDAQFALIGIILGLAIYNHVILDVQFPMVVYRKLMGKIGTLEDMQLSHPVLYSSLKQVLEYEGNVADDFMLTFTMSRKNVFGETITHMLKEDGESITVTNENRVEFANLYADFLLNRLVEMQFGAFYRGFHLVIDESPLEYLFSPAEVEQLVCGSQDWDFKALEYATEYDGGFERSSETIKHFWEIVHSMGQDEQKKLLQFATGSDRVPVGGLAKLKLVIARNGPDSNRLPTAHTCFNVLLVPDYKNKEKLKERLFLSITHAKGFGML